MTVPNGRRRNRPVADRRTFAGDLREALLVLVREATALTWPSPRYAADPVGFCRDILGYEPWSKQREIMRAVAEHPLTSVRSGHKIGKSHVGGSLGMWFYCSFEDARVVCTSPSAPNLRAVLWRAIQQFHSQSGRCLACTQKDPNGTRPCEHGTVIDGKIGELPGTGLVAQDFREVKGYTVRDVEAIAGVSGRNLLFIIDESSGVADAIFQALEGNRAGWTRDGRGTTRTLLIGNPTRTVGEFYDSHNHPKKKLVYHRIHVSSRETPNVVQRRDVIPGLATHHWVEQMDAKYGKDSAFVKVRVDGEFPVGEDGKAFSIALLTEAQERYDETEGVGVLQIGIDPAGESGTGDETAMAPRRGHKLFPIRRRRGLSEEGHAAELLGLIEDMREHEKEKAVVVIDSEGKIGWDVYVYLRNLSRRPGATFELHRVRTSNKAVREPQTFDLVRDELAHRTYLWIKEGGALPEDEMLETELHALEWERGVAGRSKITPKKKLRKMLERSPDSYDALALAVWPVLSEADEEDELGSDDDDDDEFGMDIDPYADEGIDPYG